MEKRNTIVLDEKLCLCLETHTDMVIESGKQLKQIATAIFANSPFTEGKPNNYLSMTRLINITLHVFLYLLHRFLLTILLDEQPLCFDQYVDYAIDVPMYFVYHENKYIDCTGMSFSTVFYSPGKLPCLPGELPTLNDWENHLTTIFPEVYCKILGADGGPRGSLCALPAFWLRLLYDDVSLQNVLDITAYWTTEERQMWRNYIFQLWSISNFKEGLLWHVAQDVLKFSEACYSTYFDGLERRGYKESGFLNAVAEVARTSEKLLEMYHGKWAQSVDHVFQELLY
ncbi:hypothetical protein Dsin_007098 [Dipteronia sinensis]|uniref:glutamate--cysteine ligase n=1 Tax=Dipteronia sinensis TaxID=43782 RepID=A0AAE0AZW0_9ROSI|nr:hypothetical protein Dsin_007098 [Dipteronia sinensis]